MDVIDNRKLSVKNFKQIAIEKYQKSPIPSWFSRMVQDELIKIEDGKVSATAKGSILHSACELDIPVKAFMILSLVYVKVNTLGKYYRSFQDFVNFYKLSGFYYTAFDHCFTELSNKKIVAPYYSNHRRIWTIADPEKMKKYHKVLVGIYTYMVNTR